MIIPTTLNCTSFAIPAVENSLFYFFKPDHSALAKRVCPDPFLRDSVRVPQGLPLMDGGI